MHKGIQEFWDKTSNEYRFKQWEKSAVAKFDYTFTKNALLKYLQPNKTDTILEIGCGPGKWTKLVSKKCKELTAVDISKEMCGEARRYCKNKNVRFINKDFAKLRISKKFDKVFAIRSIEYIKDKITLINKISLLLKEGGKLVIITKSRPCMWGLTKKSRGFWQEKIPYKNLKKICRKAGFHNIEVEPVIIRLPVFASGNREFPLVNKKYEDPVLKFFARITERAQSNKRWNPLSLAVCESYLLHAEKNR